MENLKAFVTIKPALQKILKGLLHIEEETRVRQKTQKRINLLEQADK
jgi:hypothetical protein